MHFNTGLPILLLIILLVNCAHAQTTDEYGFIDYQVNSSTITFNCYENPKTGYVVYSNSTYNEDEIRKEYPLCEVLYTYQSYGYRVDVDNNFSTAFVNSFGNEKIRMLAKKKRTNCIGIFT